MTRHPCSIQNKRSCATGMRGNIYKMKIAYFILAHHKPKQLLRMLNAIYSPNHIYLIHIDAKSDDSMFALANQLRDNPNIYFLSSRMTTWGGWSLVQAEIDAMKFLLSDPRWTTYINLSGQDFPLMKQEKIEASIIPGVNYMEILDSQQQRDASKLTTQLYYVEDMGKIEVLGHRKLFNEYFEDSVKQYRGSQWKILSRQFVQYVVTSEFSHTLQDYYRYTFIPDEEFFQTLIMNSEYAETLERDNRRYIKGYFTEDNFTFKAKNLAITDVKAMFDGSALFARKFDADEDPNVLDMLEGML